MIFPTLNFLLFFTVLWPLSWACVRLGRHGLHKLIIIFASYFFYSMWSWQLTGLLFGSVVLNWLVGHCIVAAKSPWLRQLAVISGVSINLSVLGFFKYYGWFSEELNALLLSLHVGRELPLLEIVLPIGISFYTFQGISYVVDLYRRDLDRPRPLIDVMFFISFFPHLVAGPIVRAASFLPQLERPPNPDRVFVGLGVMLILWGVFKKVVVANWLAVSLVDKVYFDPSAYGTIDLLAAIYGYAVQIYCDFSAYSDIAIGVAALLGYRFQRNFNQPYRAETLAEFWRRWHISLSSWLRDYLYIPLGGSRHGRVRTSINLMVTMVLGGIWHGAAWKFVVWGALHGGILVLERMLAHTGKLAGAPVAQPMWRRIVAVAITFHVVCLGWIFFRADTAQQAIELIVGLAKWTEPTLLVTPFLLSLIAFGLVIQFTPPNFIEYLDRAFHRLPTWLAGGLAGIVLLFIEVVGGDSSAPFIYFQF